MVGLGAAGVGAVAMGDPGIRPEVAEELLDYLLGAPGTSDKASVLTAVETHNHQLRLPTRNPVSSKQITLLLHSQAATEFQQVTTGPWHVPAS
jgi:hypothetical protein